jgi:hypothetical protein
VGSFFSFRPPAKGGSYQVNPPFDPETIRATIAHIRHLLTTSSAPLSFCYVAPFGGREQNTRLLQEMKQFIPSPRGYKLIEADNGSPAWFMQGSQHDKNTASKLTGSDILGHSFPAKVPTTITFFQNAAGMAKWPVTESKMNALVTAIKKKPSNELFKTAKNFSGHESRSELVARLENQISSLPADTGRAGGGGAGGGGGGGGGGGAGGGEARISREVIVENVPNGMPEKELRKALSVFGQVDKIFEKHQKNHTVVVYAEERAAKAAIASTSLQVPDTVTWLVLVDPKISKT